MVLSGAGPATLEAGTSVESVPLPNPWFDPSADLAGWDTSPRVSLDPSCGARGKGCLQFRLDAKRSYARASTKTPVALRPWHWYRLSFSYRLSPGLTTDVDWSETDGYGVVHTRSTSDRLHLAPAFQFTRASFEFISRPDVTACSLGFHVRLVHRDAKPGAWRVDDLRLEAVRPATPGSPRRFPRAVVNHDFEWPLLVGYFQTYGSARVAVVADPHARSGQGCLRHTSRSPKDGTHGYATMREDFVLAYGRMYRITAWARGPGRLDVAFATEHGWLLDRRRRPGPHKQQSPNDVWRAVRSEFTIDHREFRNVRTLLLTSGNVDVDCVRIERLR